MIESYPWLSVLPPVVAIGIAIKFRQVYIALMLGIWSGTTILADGNVLKGLADAIDACVNVFKSEDNTKIIMFSAFIGALLAFTQRSGGVQGFIEYVSKKNIITSKRRAQLMAVGIGASIPIESSISILITGTISRPIFDKFKISREKLAYLCDSTCAPICTLIPLNAWGVYVAGLISQHNVSDPFTMYLYSIPLNFYSIFALVLMLSLVLSKKDYFSMKRAEHRAESEGKVLRDGATPLVSTDVISLPPKENITMKASNMLIPVATMIVMMIVSLFITGNGNFTEGSASTSVLWAVSSAIAVGGLKYWISGMMRFDEIVNLFFKGVGGLIPIAILMMFAFAIGQLCIDLSTGVYVAGVTSKLISPQFFPLVLFLTTGFIAFSTGTSWGTWAIMIPIGMGIAQNLDISFLPFVGAIVSGGVFGDHCSPISDTTLVSSMASASDHIDHVNTQLPYALIAAALASIGFIVLGIVWY